MAPGDTSVQIVTPYAMAGAIFDGVDDHVSIATSSTIDFGVPKELMSISLWIKTSYLFDGTQRDFIRKGAGNDVPVYIHQLLIAADNAIRFRVYDGTFVPTVTVSAATGFTINSCTWYHIVAIKDGTNIKIYANGNLIDSAADTTITDMQSATGLELGTANWNGTLSEVRIWKRVLSQVEITALANKEQIPSRNSLVGEWLLKDNYLDTSGYGNNGTNTGSRLGMSESVLARTIKLARTASTNTHILTDTSNGKQVIYTNILQA